MRSIALASSIAVALLLAPAEVLTQTSTEQREAGETFTAVALGAGGINSSPVATPVDIVIERWSTDAERRRALEAVKEGQDELLHVLKGMPSTGRLQTPGALAWDLRYAHQEPMENGGRRIILATDRPMTAAEVFYQPRTIDYPFTVIELRLDASGKGEGKLSRATRIVASRNGKTIHIENYETQPVDLTQVMRK